MKINKLPSRKLRLKEPLKVTITEGVLLLEIPAFIADITHYGLLIKGIGKTPKRARKRLARKLVEHYKLLKQIAEDTPFNQRMWNRCRSLIEEIEKVEAA